MENVENTPERVNTPSKQDSFVEIALDSPIKRSTSKSPARLRRALNKAQHMSKRKICDATDNLQSTESPTKRSRTEDVPSSAKKGRTPSAPRSTISVRSVKKISSPLPLLEENKHEGFIMLRVKARIMSSWKKRFMSIDHSGVLTIFDDAKKSRPISSVPVKTYPLLTCNVRDAPSKDHADAFELLFGGLQETLVLCGVSEDEGRKWCETIEQEAQYAVLSSFRSVEDEVVSPTKAKLLDVLVADEMNQCCAECNASLLSAPIQENLSAEKVLETSFADAWASINLGVFICVECSGIHRSLGVQTSQVRSVSLDNWSDEQIDSVKAVGNRVAGNEWEQTAKPSLKPTAESSRNKKEEWVRAKYLLLQFCKPTQPSDNIAPVEKMAAPKEGLLFLDETEFHFYEREVAHYPHWNLAVVDADDCQHIISVLMLGSTFIAIDRCVTGQRRVEQPYTSVRRHRGMIAGIRRLSSHTRGPQGISARDIARHIVTGTDVVVDVLRHSDIAKELIAFEQSHVHVDYKAGVLFCDKGQEGEDVMYHNLDGSKKYRKFLKNLGEHETLLQMEGFNGGLDVKSNTTGAVCVRTTVGPRWLLYHVATFLPYQEKDAEQCERKRHIGNDVVVVVFQENNDELQRARIVNSVQSQFNHVFIFVSEKDDEHYMINIEMRMGLSRDELPPFAPPSCVWPKSALCKSMSTLVINTERAAYHAPRFANHFKVTRVMQLDRIAKEMKR